jgi:hypothetical protein
MASAGIGSGNHISGELFKMMTGVDLVHVPYRGIQVVHSIPAAPNGVGQALDAAENVSIFVQYRPARSTPVAGTITGQRG